MTEYQCGGSCTCSWKTGFNSGHSEAREIIEAMVCTLHPNTILGPELETRRQRGYETYGPDFVGDPAAQAWEEALDLAIYLGCKWYETGDVRWVQLMRDQARINERLRELTREG